MRRKVYLHVGAHKTASSLLQSAVRMLRAQLSNARLSVLFRDEQLEDEVFRAVLSPARDLYKTLVPGSADHANWLDSRFGQNASLLVTNEDLLSSLSVKSFFGRIDSSLDKLLAVFDDCEIQVILYTRNQPDFVESVYLQQLHMGRVCTFKEFLDECGDIDLDWLKVAEKIAGEPRVAKLSVRPYESILRIGAAAFVRDFLSILGLEAPEALESTLRTLSGRKQNRSFSGKAVDMYLACRGYLSEEELKKFRAFLQNHFSTESYPKPDLLSEFQRTKLLAHHETRNRALFEKYMWNWRDEEPYYRCGNSFI